MKTYVILILTAIFLAACPAIREITPVPPVITDSDMCPAACQRLDSLGCEEGRPVSVGIACNSDSECNAGDNCFDRQCVTSCDNFCRDTQMMGVWLNPDCVSHISTCDQVEVCAMPQREN